MVRRLLDNTVFAASIFLAVIIMASFVNASATPETTPNTDVPKPQYAEQQLSVIAERVNATRIASGLQPLAQSKELDQVAESRARDMAENAYYAHQGANGTYFYDIMKQKGVEAGYACENLDLSENLNTNEFMNDWLGSTTGHRECLLDNRVTEAGYAITKILVSNGVPINEYAVVAIYGQAHP